MYLFLSSQIKFASVKKHYPSDSDIQNPRVDTPNKEKKIKLMIIWKQSRAM